MPAKKSNTKRQKKLTLTQRLESGESPLVSAEGISIAAVAASEPTGADVHSSESSHGEEQKRAQEASNKIAMFLSGLISRVKDKIEQIMEHMEQLSPQDKKDLKDFAYLLQRICSPKYQASNGAEIPPELVIEAKQILEKILSILLLADRMVEEFQDSEDAVEEFEDSEEEGREADGSDAPHCTDEHEAPAMTQEAPAMTQEDVYEMTDSDEEQPAADSDKTDISSRSSSSDFDEITQQEDLPDTLEPHGGAAFFACVL